MMCGTKKLKFIKEQKTSGLLSSSGIKTLLSSNLLVGPLLFQRYKMNEIVKQVLVMER